MSTDSSSAIVSRLSSKAIARGNWPVTVTRIARVLVAIPALIGVFAWLTLIPVLLLTFLFVQPLFLIGMAMFLIAATVGGKTVLLHRYRSGDIVFKAGDAGDFVYVVRSGQFEASGGDWKRGATEQFGPGASFGVHALLGHGRHPLTVRALGDGELIRIDPVDLSDFIIDTPLLENTLREILAECLAVLNRES